MFGDEGLTVERDYFQGREPDIWDEPGTYADPKAQTENNVTYEWRHPLGEVVSAVASAGLSVELLHEQDYTVSPRWPFLEESGLGAYRSPEGMPRLPLMYSLQARKV